MTMFFMSFLDLPESVDEEQVGVFEKEAEGASSE